MYQIVKFSFPFVNDFNKAKPRPSLVISPSFGKYNQTILAYITTNLEGKLDTDIFLDSKHSDFRRTSLYSPSLIKLHRLITVTPSQINEVIGFLPNALVPELKGKLMQIFQLRRDIIDL